MSEQQLSEELEKNVVAKGPGDVLQAARIEQGISLDDIARQMNLNAKILKSIEEDDYSDVQSPIFIRGYLRTYARLVGIDEDNTIKVFGEFYQKDDPEIKSIGNTAPEISSNDFRVKWMTYIVIIGLLALLSVWWVNNYKALDLSEISNQQETVQSDNETISNETVDSASNSDLGNAKSTTVLPVEDIELHNEKTDVNQDQIISVKSNMNVEAELEKLNDVEKLTDAEEIPLNESTTEIADVLMQNVTTVDELNETNASAQSQDKLVVEAKIYTQENNATNGDDVLEINVIATSWGEIKDASNFKLLQDLMNAGNTYRLVGQKPFKIFLGNGYGVELALNGHSIDFSQHIKSSNNTARFELEQ